MKKKTAALVLALALVIGAFTSCAFIGGEKYLTEAEALGLIAGIEGGSVNNINITVEGSNDVVSASRSVLSTVSVECTFNTKYYYYFPYAQTVNKTETASGSGVVYKLDKDAGEAYVITNYHVVYHNYSTADNKIADQINLYLYGMEYEKYAIPATYVGGSMAYDLAVLKVENSDVIKTANVIAAGVANSDEVSLLETAIAIGNPGGISATAGYINVDSEYMAMLAPDKVTNIELRVIRTSAPVNPGNSGGGLYNAEGELIGIVNAKSAEESTDNKGYAIPSNVAKYVADNIIYYCDETDNECVKKAIVGIDVGIAASRTEYDEESGKITKLETVVVTEVAAGGAAFGKLKAGDVINTLTVGGNQYQITRDFQVIDLMINARVGDTVTFGITRSGAETSVSIEITEAMLNDII